MSVKFWSDPVSQPCRTIDYILRKLEIDHDTIEVRVVKDTRTDDFKKNVNPQGKVPVIEHEGQKFVESATIIRYLLDSFKGDETLLPREDIKKRAKVDYWLDWNNTTGRPAFTGAMAKIILIPKFFGGAEATEEEKKSELDNYYSTLNTVEHALANQSYLTGDNLTIADVQLYNEINETKILLDLNFNEHINTKGWLVRMSQDDVIKKTDETLQKRLGESEDK